MQLGSSSHLLISNFSGTIHRRMPLLQNAKKALRSSQAKNIVNRKVKSHVKTAVDAMKQKPSAETLSKAYSALDRGVKHKLFHANKAGRVKHQLSRLLSA